MKKLSKKQLENLLKTPGIDQEMIEHIERVLAGEIEFGEGIEFDWSIYETEEVDTLYNPATMEFAEDENLHDSEE